MPDKRRLTLAVTIFVTADLNTEGENTHVNLISAEHSALGSILPLAEAESTTPGWQRAMAVAAAKLGLRYVLNTVDGSHSDPAPEVTQAGASA